ncbi:MAG: zinc-binding dehydrogenase [Armatimonadetes bacterium]|nr:zinc-binding dehydrogenase [Armatimonadota bacterium]
MRKAVISGERKAGLVDVPDPQPVQNWVVVKVHAAPVCTEYKAFLEGQKSDFLGHEAAGEVVAVAQPSRVKMGDRVVVQPLYPCGKCELCVAGEYIHCENGYDFDRFTGSPEGKATMAQYLLKPDWMLSPIPEAVSYERASLACCALGPSFGAFNTMGVSAFDTVLIAGAGPVGLGAVINARFRGARVIVAESVPYRVEKAKELDAEAVIDPNDSGAVEKIRELTKGKGVDCALDCAGNVPAERLCIDAACRKGKVAFVGECHAELPIRVGPDLLRKGLTVLGNWHYNLADFPLIMQVIQRLPLVGKLISHIMPLGRIQEALELSASHQTAKVILKPWEDE